MADILFLNSTYKPKLKSEVNGTMLLATSLLQAGMDADILRFYQIPAPREDYPRFVEECVRQILARNPKCVSFYCLWVDYTAMLRIARTLKAQRPDISVILGGPQATATAPETLEAMDYIDYICTGEGETTVVPFFRALLAGDEAALAQIPGLCRRVNGIPQLNPQLPPLCDLNTLPYWDDRLLTHYLQNPEADLGKDDYFMPIDAGRGCPFRCTFCCTSTFWRRNYRLKAPERLIEEIRYYGEKFGIHSFWFTHDAFTVNNALVEAFCDRLLEENIQIKWRCTSRIDCISRELLLKMQKAGMVGIEFGIETGSPEMQKRIRKNLDLDAIRDMVPFLLKNRIHTTLFFMYGFPDETEDELAQTVKLALDLIDRGIRNVSMSFCSFNPKTVLTEQYFDRLVLEPDIPALFRDNLGCREELETVAAHKALFPFYYHLDTPLRREYRHLHYFVSLYARIMPQAKYLRQLYRGDDLALFRDFVRGNADHFHSENPNIGKLLLNDAHAVIGNTLRGLTSPAVSTVLEVFRYGQDARSLAKQEEDFTLEKAYRFHYLEFQLGIRADKLSEAVSEIRFQKKNGRFSVNLIGVQDAP